MKNWGIIVAIGENYEIGKDNDLLCHISDDLKRFKAITTGHTIVMGRKTFESLPKGALPNRRNIVLSTQNIELQGAEVYHSVEEIKQATKNDESVFIIGGASIYKQLLNEVNQMFLTRIKARFEADAFFPKFDINEWEVTHSESVEANEKNEYPHTFEKLRRKE